MLNRSVSGVVEWFIARSEPSHGLWLATVGEGWGRCSFALRECKGSASLRYSVGRLVGEQLETDPQQVGVTRPGRAYGTAELTRCHLERTTGFEPATRTLARCWNPRIWCCSARLRGLRPPLRPGSAESAP